MAKPLRLLFLPFVLSCAPGLSAQTVHHYTGSNSSSNWTGTNSWSTGVVPQSPLDTVSFGTLNNIAQDRINMLATSSVWNTTATAVTGSMVFLPTLNTTATSFLVRNSSTGTPGFLNLHGVMTEVDGSNVNLLIGNFGAPVPIIYSTANAAFTIRLQNSGVIHVDEGASVDIRVVIANDGTPRGITKTGDGILRFGLGSSDPHSTYGGGFTLEGGIVEWAQSGGRSANPFGAGDAPMVLRAGSLRSSNTGGRSINVPVHLDGTVTFGSDDAAFNGGIAVNSQSGNLRSEMLSDSTITTLTRVSWNQSIDGDGNLTKAGPETLAITTFSNSSTFTGTVDITAGTLELMGSLPNNPVTIQDGAHVTGTGMAFGLTVRSGGTLSPGLDATRGALTTGSLALEAGAFFQAMLDSNALGGYDSVVATGPISLDGAELSVALSFSPAAGNVFVLIENRNGAAIDGLLSLLGTPLAQGDTFSITTGDFSGEFQIDYEHLAGEYGNSLAIIAVPEPAAWGVLAGLLTLGLAIRRRRNTQ